MSDEAKVSSPDPSPSGKPGPVPQRGGFRRRTLIKATLAAGPLVMTIRSRPAFGRGGGDKSKDSAKWSARLSSKPKK